jgi:hypothetical protein
MLIANPLLFVKNKNLGDTILLSEGRTGKADFFRLAHLWFNLAVGFYKALSDSLRSVGQGLGLGKISRVDQTF